MNITLEIHNNFLLVNIDFLSLAWQQSFNGMTEADCFLHICCNNNEELNNFTDINFNKVLECAYRLNGFYLQTAQSRQKPKKFIHKFIRYSLSTFIYLLSKMLSMLN